MATAIGLAASDVALFIGLEWAWPAYTFFAGMLTYTAIVSPGYFVQHKQMAWLYIFLGVMLLNCVALGRIW